MTSNSLIHGSEMIDLEVSRAGSSILSMKRFQKDVTILAFKGKLELISGVPVQNMVLELYNKDNCQLATLSDDFSVLGSYPVDSGMRIHVIDKSGGTGDFEDLSKVEKFELSPEEYAKRNDSVRAFKQRMKMGQFKEVDPAEKQRLEEEKLKKAAEEKEKISNMKIGDRCEVTTTGQPTKRGAVQYIGETKFKPGVWIGVQFDEPLGKNDGSVEGHRYFTCPPKYGGFSKAANITVGDFPELGLDDDMEM